VTETIVYSERPELWERIEGFEGRVWPEYNRHGAVLNRFWARLYDDFADYQFVLYDRDDDVVLGEGHSIPCSWDGVPSSLPEGIDDIIQQGFALREAGGRPNTLCALAAEIPPEHRQRRLSTDMIEAMRALASERGFNHLVAPLRPNWKERYPITPIERYCEWTRPDGLPFDPWMRVHVRLGGEVLRSLPRSLLITGTVAEWETWTEMSFPSSGDYVFPHGLATVSIDVERDIGTYWEPNVWISHTVPIQSHT
jgi:hypothetical protein